MCVCVCVCVCWGWWCMCHSVCVCACVQGGWGGTTETVQLWSCIYFPSHLTSMFCIQNCSIFVDINTSNMYTCTAKNKKQSSPLSLSLSSQSKDLIGNEWTWQTYCNIHNPHKVPSVLNPNCIAAWYKMASVLCKFCCTHKSKVHWCKYTSCANIHFFPKETH